MSKGTVILKKLGGLGTIKSLKGQPTEYYTNSKDRDKDGEYAGVYREKTLPNARHWLAPYWNDLKNQHCWGGTREQLDLIVDEVKFTFEKGHPRVGEVIKPSDVDLFSIRDPFFSHSKWSLNKAMQGGRIMLNRDNPIEEFFHLSYKGNHMVVDRTEGETSLNAVGGAKYELVNPKTAKARRAKDAKKEVDALKLLAANSYQRQQLIAEIMDLKTYDVTDPDPDSLFVALKDEAAENTEISSRFGNKTWQDVFIDLADKKMHSNDDLEIMALVIRGKRLGILRQRGNYYQFNTGNNNLSDRIEGQLNDSQLINFFRKVDHQEHFLALEKAVKGKQK